LEGDVRSICGWSIVVVELGRLENDALSISFAMALTLYTVLADRPFFATLYATPSTSQTSSLSAFPGQFGIERRRSGRHVCFGGITVWALTFPL
jgi:hypothetical protein